MSSGYAMCGQAGMSGTGTGRRSASLRREKACYRKKAISFPKCNRKQNLQRTRGKGYGFSGNLQDHRKFMLDFLGAQWYAKA